MKFAISLVALVFALTTTAAPASAQGRGQGQAKKADQTMKAPKTQTQKAPKTDAHGKPSTTATSHGKSGAEHGKSAAIKADKAPKAEKAPKSAKNNPTTTTTTEVTPTTPTTTLGKNPKLEAKLMDMLKARGATYTDIQQAASGFKNWGQFVAAVHVSKNLNLDFAALKAAMTGIPVGSPAGTLAAPDATRMSLGQAIQSVGGGTTTPDGETLTTTKIRNEVKKAEDAANTDLRNTRTRG